MARTRTLTFRLSRTLRGRLEELREARGLPTLSAAVKTAIVEAVMSPEERATVPDRDELLRLLGIEARAGSVTAMRLLLREAQDEDEPPPERPRSAIDELVARRQRRLRGDAG